MDWDIIAAIIFILVILGFTTVLAWLGTRRRVGGPHDDLEDGPEGPEDDL